MNRNVYMLPVFLVLAACNQTIEISVQNSPVTLRGNWEGEFKIRSQAYSVDIDPRRQILLDSTGTTFFLRDLQTGKVLKSVEAPEWLGDVQYRKDDRLVSSDGFRTFILNPETLEVLQTFNFGGRVSQDGSHVITSEYSPEIYDTRTGQRKAQLSTGHYGVYAISEDAHYGLLKGQVLDLWTGEVRATPQAPTVCPHEPGNGPVAISFDPAHHRLAVAYEQQWVEVWDTLKWELVFKKSVYGCSDRYTRLSLQGNTLAYLTSKGWGSVNLENGQQSHHEQETLTWDDRTFLSAGRWYINSGGGIQALNDTGVLWNITHDVEGQEKVMAVQTTARYQNSSQYLFEGHLHWNGEEFQLTGNGHGHLVEFKQMTPADLRASGTLTSKGGHRVGALECSMMLTSQNVPETAAYWCVFRRGTVEYLGHITRKP